ncbi:MAG: hypothetical protein OYH77_06990 [Pseudomonadota bacterium]|nr:hypothetical protein [Pseudomonadota bacterium]
MRHLILAVLATACFDHDSKKMTTGTGDSKTKEGTLTTSVDGNKFKVEIAGSEVLLFEVDERLRFSRLVFAEVIDEHAKICTITDKSNTIAGGEIKKQKCFVGDVGEKFIKACIELGRERQNTREALEYRLDYSEGEIPELQCGVHTATGGSNLIYTYASAGLFVREGTLPDTHTFDADNITKENLQNVLDNARLCASYKELTFDQEELTCTCKPDAFKADKEYASLFTANPTCADELSKTVHLLLPFAKEKESAPEESRE